MVGKKWYVVIVGKAVGVFASWWVIPSITGVSELTHVRLNNYRLEVAPLVIGVSGARHQSFPTEEEAIQAFRNEVMRGRVKVVNGGFGSSPRPSYNSYSEFPSAPSTPRRSHSHSTHVSAGQSPFGNSNTPVRRANSDLSYTDYGNMAEARHPERMTASPANSSAGYTSLHSVSVRTPSGLGYYPDTASSLSTNTSRSLTPLLSPKLSFGVEGTGKHANVNMSPHHSRVQSPVRDPHMSPSVQGSNKRYVKAMVCDGCAERAAQKCLCCNRTIGGGGSPSGVFSSVQVPRRTVYDKQMDPRSPMAKEPYVPSMMR